MERDGKASRRLGIRTEKKVEKGRWRCFWRRGIYEAATELGRKKKKEETRIYVVGCAEKQAMPLASALRSAQVRSPSKHQPPVTSVFSRKI